MKANKDQAYEFLHELERDLNARIPAPPIVADEIARIMKSSKHDPSQKHKRSAESAFLNHYVIPKLYELIARRPDMDREKATSSLLSENFRHLNGMASGTPARRERHPFKKALVGLPRTVMSQWRGQGVGSPLVQACPDFALRKPFPFKIVFEGKYFAQGGIKLAETELVTDLYQAFFYLGLPLVPETKRSAAWEYDYSCLLAFDASADQTYHAAWNSIAKNIRDGFWSGANIYVMILRGNDGTIPKEL